MRKINIRNHQLAQQYAKETIAHLIKTIHAGMTELEVVDMAEKFLRQKGVDFWYYGIGAFVFLGRRTCISQSGKFYKPTNIKVSEEDIITVDLNPAIDGCWGDFARTLIISKGKVMGVDSDKLTDVKFDFLSGIIAGETLHKKLIEEISLEKTFGDLFDAMNEEIEKMDFVNLDFNYNLGHTIEKKLDERRYIEEGNETKFRDVGLFTFEPHIKAKSESWGFKREDIYYFSNNELKIL